MPPRITGDFVPSQMLEWLSDTAKGDDKEMDKE